MLYALFIYQKASGLLLWSASFEKDLDKNRLELFSGFFSAIQSFISEMLLNESQCLSMIDLGNFSISVTNAPEIGVDIISIIDHQDQRSLNRILPKIMSVCNNHKELFLNWNGDVSIFSVLNIEIIPIVQSDRNIGNENLNPIDVEFNQSFQQCYIAERQFLYCVLSVTVNINKKIELLTAIKSTSEKIHDNEGIQHADRLLQQELKELDITRQRVTHFIVSTKTHLQRIISTKHKNCYDLDFKEVYTNFYSLSSKLKNIGREDLANRYKLMAKLLIDKPPNKEHDLSRIISYILRLPTDPDSFNDFSNPIINQPIDRLV